MRGWSLLELMIVLAILAILAAYAVPSYRHHRRTAYRADAVAALYRAALFVERRHDERVMDSADASAESKGSADSHESLPRELDHTPPQGRAAYRLSLHQTDDDDYVLKASPLADGPMRDDIECGTLLLYQNGRRAIDTGTAQDGEAIEHCWG